jgi:hypothetical protein
MPDAILRSATAFLALVSTGSTEPKDDVVFMDPIELSFRQFKDSLVPGFRFDYGENGLRATVEVLHVQRGEMIALDLLVVDDTFSRPRPPRKGDRFRASFRATESPFQLWNFYPEGHFRRYEEWCRQQDEE